VGGVPGNVGNSPGVAGGKTPELGGKTPAFGGRTPAFGGMVPGKNGAVGLSGLKRGCPFGKKPCAPFVIPPRATFPAGLVNAAAAGFVKNRLLFVPVKMFVRPKSVSVAGEKRGRSENGAWAIALAATRKLKYVSGVFITHLSALAVPAWIRASIGGWNQKVCREVQRTRDAHGHFAKKKRRGLHAASQKLVPFRLLRRLSRLNFDLRISTGRRLHPDRRHAAGRCP
jgi:hypothetical protein